MELSNLDEPFSLNKKMAEMKAKRQPTPNTIVEAQPDIETPLAAETQEELTKKALSRQGIAEIAGEPPLTSEESQLIAAYYKKIYDPMEKRRADERLR